MNADDTRQGQEQADGQHMQEGERLVRFLAHAGVASRRHAEKLISEGRVQVNGATVITPGTRIDPQRDRVTVDAQPVQLATQHVYIMLHKPTGYVSTVTDQQRRPTVLDLVPEELRRLRLYPVGRLDLDTSGLLLLTNDGEFALRMTHPRYATEKRYEALIKGHPSAQALRALREGVSITEDDGRMFRTSPAQVRVLRHVGGESWLELIIHEGHKRQVRRMLEVVGHPVHQLVRVAVGPLTLKGLPVGSWRYLTPDEVRALMQKTHAAK
jgi:pseudouridine synthase